MAKEVTGNKITFFGVDGEGYIYSHSNTQLEGYKPHYNKEGVLKGYRKIYSATDDGYIQDLRFTESKFKAGNVPMLSITIQGADGLENIKLELYNGNKALSPYVKSIAMFLPNVDFSKRYSISFDKKKDEKGYLKKNVYFNNPDDEGKTVGWFHKPKTQNIPDGDIPPAEQKTDLMGKPCWDFTKQDDYLIESLKKQVARFAEFKGGVKPLSENTPDVEEVKTVIEEEVGEDDLPF